MKRVARMHSQPGTTVARWHPRSFAPLFIAANLSLGACQSANSPDNLRSGARPALEARAGSLLLDARPQSPVPLFLFTDPNKDPDDLTVLVLLSFLQRQGFVDLRSVATTLGDRTMRERRAQFAKDVLEELRLPEVPVGVDVDYGFEVMDAHGRVDSAASEGRRKDHEVFLDTPFERPQGSVAASGVALMETELARVPDGSAVLLVNAGMAGLAALLRKAPEQVRIKTSTVVIMGGIAPALDARGFVTADQRAYNNTTHQPSADYVYARVQELGIPLVVVTREAAYAAAAPRSFYDGMAATGNPIGVSLANQQKQSLAKLWSGIQSDHLPQALTTEWFFQTFTDVDIGTPAGRAALVRAEENADDFEAIWKQVSKFNLYDPLALLVALPEVGKLLFHYDAVPGTQDGVRIIDDRSLVDSDLLEQLLSWMAIRALSP